MTEDCIFCKLANGKIPRKFEYEDENIAVFESNAPVADTHLLIVPKKHISTFMDLDGEIEDLFKVAQKMIKDKNLTDGYRLCFNGGKYQEVMHVHLHLLAGDIKSNP